ncbi:MAG: histidinol dehydrogenase [Woeseiaceae bacterium]|nr:histidinol dehydrogenase [Woeseiaceae bacterium]
MLIPISIWQEQDAAARAALLKRPAIRSDAELQSGVVQIIESVKTSGDAALRSLTARLDQVELDDFEISSAEIDAATQALSPQQASAIDAAIQNVKRFHEAQLPAPVTVDVMPGVRCERISHPIDSVGLYVPAGTAPLPSAAIMLAVPAAIAACPVKVMCTPPRPDGAADPAVIVAATKAGIERIFKLGGAQAIAAMAFGTESIPKVQKIFGPGNAWVTRAKTAVSADPDGAAIDMPAGPSEVLVIADENANPAFIAADLLSQAEHGVDSQVVLVTTSRSIADSVNAELDAQLGCLSRKAIAAEALQSSLVILVDSVAEAIDVSNRYAPEHLILQVDNAPTLVTGVRNAGSVFVGPWAPESVGDYCSGTNHVLPTYGYARSYSGLGVDQFLRHMTVQNLTRDGLESLAETVTTLASMEGLDAHARAVSIRTGATT